LEIKAWAFFDSDDDDEVDTTIWTTANGCMKADEKLDSTDAMDGYDYYTYPFLFPRDDIENGAGTELRYPLEISDAETTIDLAGNEIPMPEVFQIDLRLDTFRLPMGWDGDSDFRESLFDSVLLPDDEPAFVLESLPFYGLFNEPEAVTETYALGPDQTFPLRGTTTATILFSSDGTPVFGTHRTVGADGYPELDLPWVLGLFEETAPGVWSYGSDNAFYDWDPDNAMVIVKGFQRLDPSDAPIEVTIEDGPNCNPCYGTQTFYLKRLQRGE
ncbi:MAG: hypothetical protein HN348_18010, partial [Proteobacteria bacterium]|nr:hypothetical protein [Pseudomonadota bacterium]